MKLLNELLQLNEDVNFKKLQHQIYDYVLKRLKLPHDITLDLDDIMKNTDNLWVGEFDSILKCIEEEYSLSDIYNKFFDATYAIIFNIDVYLDKKWKNKYDLSKYDLDNINIGPLERKDVKQILNKSYPGLVNRLMKLKNNRNFV